MGFGGVRGGLVYRGSQMGFHVTVSQNSCNRGLSWLATAWPGGNGCLVLSQNGLALPVINWHLHFAVRDYNGEFSLLFRGYSCAALSLACSVQISLVLRLEYLNTTTIPEEHLSLLRMPNKLDLLPQSGKKTNMVIRN